MEHIPYEILYLIANYLDSTSLINFSMVNKSTQPLRYEQSLWSNLSVRNYNYDRLKFRRQSKATLPQKVYLKLTDYYFWARLTQAQTGYPIADFITEVHQNHAEQLYRKISRSRCNYQTRTGRICGKKCMAVGLCYRHKTQIRRHYYTCNYLYKRGLNKGKPCNRKCRSNVCYRHR